MYNLESNFTMTKGTMCLWTEIFRKTCAHCARPQSDVRVAWTYCMIAGSWETGRLLLRFLHHKLLCQNFSECINFGLHNVKDGEVGTGDLQRKWRSQCSEVYRQGIRVHFVTSRMYGPQGYCHEQAVLSSSRHESHRYTVHFVKSLQLLANKCTYITFT